MANAGTDLGSSQQHIFLTGASGYIGGEVLHQIAQESSLRQSLVTCLVRTAGKADLIQNTFPRVRIVLGDLDDVDLIKQEARNSDIVLHFASTKHTSSARAIAEGLNDRLSQDKGRLAFWIQISGATLVAGDEIQQQRFGEYSDKVWHGLKDAEKIRALIRHSKTREVENLVMSSSSSNLHTALLVGPLIYGTGNGPVNTRSIQAPDMAKFILKNGHGFQFNDGLNRWSTIHVSDLGKMISKLVVSSTSQRDTTSYSLWDEQGIYMLENGVVTFKDLSQWIVEEAFRQGLISEPSPPPTIDAIAVNQVTPHGSILLGTNAIFDFAGAQEIPDWNLQGPSLKETITDLVASEARDMDRT